MWQSLIGRCKTHILYPVLTKFRLFIYIYIYIYIKNPFSLIKIRNIDKILWLHDQRRIIIVTLFSDHEGSLVASWLQRLLKKNPMTIWANTQRFFLKYPIYASPTNDFKVLYFFVIGSILIACLNYIGFLITVLWHHYMHKWVST